MAQDRLANCFFCCSRISFRSNSHLSDSTLPDPFDVDFDIPQAFYPTNHFNLVQGRLADRWVAICTLSKLLHSDPPPLTRSLPLHRVRACTPVPHSGVLPTLVPRAKTFSRPLPFELVSSSLKLDGSFLLSCPA